MSTAVAWLWVGITESADRQLENMMSDETNNNDDAPKLSKANMRKLNRVATGPLLGGIEAQVAPKKVSTGELAARVAPLGSILSVRARMAKATDGDGGPQ